MRECVEEGEYLGIEAQRKELQEFVSKYILVKETEKQEEQPLTQECKEYVDEGYSGATFDRPAWRQLIEDMKKGNLQTIIVSDFSRIGTDSVEVGEYLEQIFPLLGIRFLALRNNYDSKQYPYPTEKTKNQKRKRESAKKRRESLKERWQQGKSTGGRVLFGYKMNPETGEWELESQTASCVRLIFEQAMKGKSSIQISNFLNEQQFPTPGQYKAQYRKVPDAEVLWDSAKVRSILSRCEYTGTLVKGRRQNIASGSKVTRKTLEEDRIVLPNHHPAIVSENEYELAKASIRQAEKGKYRGKREFLLKGKLRCGTCHLALAYTESGSVPKLYCPHKANTGSYAACSGEMYPLALIEAKVVSEIKQFCVDLEKEKTKESQATVQFVRTQLEKSDGKLTGDMVELLVDTVYVYHKKQIEVTLRQPEKACYSVDFSFKM
ncbi:MAG: recombinase family protein [bacterium]|nr:recombinase family protein [bacterium]